MEDLIQPTLRAAFERSGPEHNGESAIEFGRESREMMPLRLRREREAASSEEAWARANDSAMLKFDAEEKEFAALCRGAATSAT